MGETGGAGRPDDAERNPRDEAPGKDDAAADAGAESPEEGAAADRAAEDAIVDSGGADE
jgi:hypothetical protein